MFDIEANDLLYGVTKLHCISTEDLDTGVTQHYAGADLVAGLKALGNAEVLIGHNICGYDIPVLQKLYPQWRFTGQLMDTLLMGCMLYPEMGIMSLENWAIKLSLETQKIQHEDWSVYTEDMGMRCAADVAINVKVHAYLSASEHYQMILNHALDTEQSVALIHARQTYKGVRFDIHKAIALLKELDERITTLRGEIVDTAPWKCTIPGTPKIRQKSAREAKIAVLDQGKIPPGTHKHITQAGTYTTVTKKWWDDDPEQYRKVKGPYTKVSLTPINPDSSDEVRELLLSLGWQPTDWNNVKDKVTGEFRVTSPKLTEDSFSSLPPGVGQTIAEYNMLTHRRRFLLNTKDNTKGALPAVHRRGDGRIAAEAFTCGTPTARYRHQGVVCNIPRPTTKYGPQVRELFCVPNGEYWLVGIDLSGIEARMLAHYLLKGNYPKAKETAQLIMSPDKGNDFHSYNAQQWGVSRDIAKNGLYALMYGAGAKKLATTLGKPEGMGAKLKKDFYKAHPGIKSLIEDLERAYGRKGWINGLDGRPLYVRSKMKLLNTLLQGGACIIFKEWMVDVEAMRFALRNGNDDKVGQVIAYHDELQFEVKGNKVLAGSWGKLVCDLATTVGERNDIKVPIEAEAKVGKNWRDCH